MPGLVWIGCRGKKFDAVSTAAERLGEEVDPDAFALDSANVRLAARLNQKR
jgi:hypothetical protein